MTAIPRSRAPSRATSSRAVFPIPGSPLRTRADPVRSISPTRRSISSRHAARPWRTGSDRRDPGDPPFARLAVLARRAAIVCSLRKTEAPFQGDYTECRWIQSDGAGFVTIARHPSRFEQMVEEMLPPRRQVSERAAASSGWPLRIQSFPGCIEAAAGDVVQAAPTWIRGLELPAAIAEGSVIRPGAVDLGDEEIISRLVVWFGDYAAGQPCCASGNERLVVASIANNSAPARSNLSGWSRRLKLPRAVVSSS